jgi:hypothetical protein
MSFEIAAPQPPEPDDHGLKDARHLWSHDVQPVVAPLQSIKLDASKQLLIPFMCLMATTELHYCSAPAVNGYTRCSGKDCLLCQLGKKRELRYLWPVYHTASRAVGILAISDSLRPAALRPLLTPVLDRLARGDRLLLAVRKLDNTRFDVEVRNLLEGVEDGAAVIGRFIQRLEAREIDIKGVYPLRSNSDLATVPEIAQELKLLGLTA